MPQKALPLQHDVGRNWLRGLDLNQRPSGYEPDELPGCSTPRNNYGETLFRIKSKVAPSGNGDSKLRETLEIESYAFS